MRTRFPSVTELCVSLKRSKTKTSRKVSDYLSHLSEVQRQAVENYEGPSLIVAGAGSGKTRVLTYRIAHMLNRGIAPYNILALTFTNKAANEMRQRIATVVPYQTARSLWMGTFHSMFLRILRNEAARFGLPASFTIYETADSRNLVKAIIREMNLNDEKYKPKDIFARISLAKNNLVVPQAYENNATLMSEDASTGRPEFVYIYKTYMQRCHRNAAMDFDDLILYTNILFRDHPEALEKYQQQFRYILVDEYQDTNYAQYLIVKRLSEARHNVCVVGDDAQSIYSFRGAKIENILRFQKDYPEAQVFKLEQNYRSTRNIVNAANSVIARNKHQLKKNAFSENEEGDKVLLNRAYTEKEEALMLADDIRKVRAEHPEIPYSDMAVLYRTNAQSQSIEEALRNKNIPYRIYGGVSFYQRREIKNVLAYARLVVNPSDDEALSRIINIPARGIGSTSIARITAAARQHGISLWDALARFSPEEMDIRGVAVKRLRGFMEMMESFRRELYNKDAYELVYDIASRSGIIDMYRQDSSPEAQSAYENVEELINSLKRQVEEVRETQNEAFLLDEWLQSVTLITDMDAEAKDDKDRVTLMTIHSAKGLEFKYVYIVGMEEGIFPSPRSAEDPNDLEEERRLFYVAITRAIKRVVISYALSRYKWGTVTQSIASRFLKEIDREYVENPEVLETNRFDDRPAARDEEAAARPPRPGERRSWGESGKPVYTRREGVRTDVRGAEAARERFLQRGSFKKVSAAATARTIGQPVASVGNIRVGSRVEHDKFGQGEVTALENTASDIKATVVFDKHGSKTLLLKFARLHLV